ncbi:DciA family protein [Chryseobacterium sp. MIQD13]|uniref:DciA family protein n=1 Tax=Chryseobacterium sp. MIQD13 TaxID=3422310 RepID=UPI003D2AF1B8
MKKNKKREFQSSELVKSFARIHGFEHKLIAFEIKDFLEDYLDESLFNEIKSVNIENKCIVIRIDSPILKHDFQMRKTFYLKKFKEKFGEEKFDDIKII